jgi:type IV pilus assembly protein PilQ
VFDLEYLKDYSIAYNDDSMLEIKFANKNKTNPQNEMLLGYNKTENPSIKADADKNNSIVEKNKNLSNSVENEKLQISEITEPATKKETIETPLTTISNNAVEAPQNKQGYFSEEKSQVTEQDLNQSYISYEDEEGNEKKAFIAKTIQSGEKQYSGELLTFEFYEIELRDIILAIAEISGLNIIMDPGISGKVTCRLHDVPWDQALEYFLKIHDLDMVQEGRLVRIGKVDKLAQEASKRKLMKEAIDMQTAREVITHPLSYAKVGEVSGLLKKHLSSRGEIQTDNRTNTLIITDIPESIQIIKKLIADLDTPVRQVSIEARIVETNTNFVRSLGIQWGYGMAMSSMYGNQTSLKFPNSINMYGNQLSSTTSPFTGPLGGYAVNLPASGSTTGMAFSLANVANTFRLDVALSAMQNQGKGRIISAPKTTTQNNMEASIMQGKQIPVQVNQNNTITVQYRPAALELKVTPQITAENTIICTIDIKNNAPDFANLVMGIPPITTQTIKTTVLIDNGGTVVIGGMYRIEDQTSQASTPFLSKIPILGNLFKDSNVRNEKKELLVFITPRIIK